MGRSLSSEPIKHEKFITTVRLIQPIADKHKNFVPRSGHCCLLGDRKFHVFGGYLSEQVPQLKEVWTFCMLKKTWKKEEFSINSFVRCGVASNAAAALSKHMFLIIGGTGYPFGSLLQNRVNLLDLHSKKMSCLSTKGEKPAKIYGSTLTICGEKVYHFGGTDGFYFHNDLHVLNLETMEWRKLSSLVINDRDMLYGFRYKHTAEFHKNRLHIIGGSDQINTYPLDLIDVYDPSTNNWLCCRTSADPTYGFPSKRKFHSMVSFNNRFYIIGGKNDDTCLKDIWVLNLKDYSWSKFPSELPQALYFHDSVITENGAVYIFGGVCEDSLRSNDVFVFNVEPLPLQEIAWNCLLNSSTLIKQFTIRDLVRIGIPQYYANLLNS